MRVLHLLKSKRFSGAENVVCQIISLLSENKDIDMVYSSEDGQIRESLFEKNIEFLPMNKLCVSEVRKNIRQYKPDIIHAHDLTASVIAAHCAPGNVKIISHIHAAFGSMNKLSLQSIVYNFYSKRFSHIFWVANSAFQNYKFKKKVKDKSSILINVIQTSELHKKIEDDTKEYNYDIVYLGRLSYQKNPQRLIGVFSKIAKINPTVKIAMIGTGDLFDETKTLVDSLSLNDNIDMLGFSTNPYKILINAKVMLMTSRYEGTPMCALEAIALGVPIVSTPTDGLCELIVENETGYLSDNDDVLVSKVNEIINNEDLHKYLSENALKYSKENMDLTKYKNSIISAYNY